MENHSSETKQDKLGCLPFVLSGLSFIPLFGIFFGIVVIVWGIIKIKLGGWKLILLGTLGILLIGMIGVGFIVVGTVYATKEIYRVLLVICGGT